MKVLVAACSVAFALSAAPLALADPPARPRAPQGEQPSTMRLPPCAPHESEDEVRLSTGCSGVFGVRGSTVDVRGVRAGEGTGVMVSEEGQELVRRGVFSARGTHRLGLGGGGAGFEGALLGSLAAGVRVPFGERHGPVIRAGVQGYLLGNDAFYDSLLELPQAQVGYQYMRGATVIEIGATSGVVLTGRHRAGDAPWRTLSGLEVGGYALAQVPWVRFATSLSRLPTHDALASDVLMADGTACVRAAPLAICADGRVSRADVLPPAGGSPIEARTLYAGITLGFTRER